MAEWSIAAVLKTVEVRASGGSNPSLSANKGVNQQVMRFTPFVTLPKKLASNKNFHPRLVVLDGMASTQSLISLLYGCTE